jgi:carbon storage regulator
MLVVRRREGESIVIGQEIEVVVAEISGSTVKLAIKAPPRILVDRKEVRLIRDQNFAAAGSGADLHRLALLFAPKEGEIPSRSADKKGERP